MFWYFRTALDGIKGFAEFKRNGGNKTHILMKIKVQIELYFFLIILTIICVAGLAAQSDFPNSLLLLIPFVPVWFWLVYRIQEKMLLKNFGNTY